MAIYIDGKRVAGAIKGEVGPKGDPGEAGPKGEDGYSPVKGTDYWTEEDQNAIIEEANKYVDEKFDGIKPEDIGAAPAGHGLGTSAADYAPLNTYGNPDANLIATTGLYRCFDNTPDGTWWTISSTVYGGSSKYQEASAVLSATSLPGATVLKRVCINDVWQPWEYENPPMLPDIEYRTTERIDDKAVYKKNVSGVIQYRLDGEAEWKNYSDLLGSNITVGTEELTSGTSTLASGKLYFCYE